MHATSSMRRRAPPSTGCRRARGQRRRRHQSSALGWGRAGRPRPDRGPRPGVRQTEIVPHGIGVADVEIGLDQLGREIGAGGTMPGYADDLIGTLAPDIAVVSAPRAAKRARIDFIESKDAE